MAGLLTARMPRDKVLTESDGPVAQLNGIPVNPWDTGHAIEALAAIWSITREEVSDNILRNLRRLVT
jgi:TatD DNase family protein